jgi:radical SAM superfamily enzyme YgiQ (UPF0313 family)
MSVTLINPPEKKRVWAGIAESMAYGVYCFPPLGLMYLQASLEKRTPLRCEIYDAIVDDMDHPEFEKGLDRYDLDVVGISAYTHSLPDVQLSIDAVRKRNPRAKIVLGGPHPIMFPEYAIGLRGVDAICTGDGDDAFVELVEAKKLDPDDRLLSALIQVEAEGDRLSPEELIANGTDAAIAQRVHQLLQRAEFKRRQAAPLLKVSNRAFGSGWRMPIACGA